MSGFEASSLLETSIFTSCRRLFSGKTSEIFHFQLASS